MTVKEKRKERRHPGREAESRRQQRRQQRRKKRSGRGANHCFFTAETITHEESGKQRTRQAARAAKKQGAEATTRTSSKKDAINTTQHPPRVAKTRRKDAARRHLEGMHNPEHRQQARQRPTPPTRGRPGVAISQTMPTSTISGIFPLRKPTETRLCQEDSPTPHFRLLSPRAHRKA